MQHLVLFTLLLLLFTEYRIEQVNNNNLLEGSFRVHAHRWKVDLPRVLEVVLRVATVLKEGREM